LHYGNGQALAALDRAAHVAPSYQSRSVQRTQRGYSKPAEKSSIVVQKQTLR